MNIYSDSQFNVHEIQTGRQANNVYAGAVVDVVRSWFSDSMSHRQIREALAALGDSRRREAAMKYLGITLTPVA